MLKKSKQILPVLLPASSFDIHENNSSILKRLFRQFQESGLGRIFLIVFALSVQTLFADYLSEKDLVVIGRNPAALKTFFSVKADSMLIVNELKTNSSFDPEIGSGNDLRMLDKIDKNILWGASVQNLLPVEGGVVITIEFSGKIEKIFSRTVVLAQNAYVGRALIEKKYQSGSFQRFFTECFEDFRVVEPAVNIFLADPHVLYVSKEKNPELLAGMMVSNLVTYKLSGRNCIFQDGISIGGIPTEKTMEYITKLKPKMFGLVGDKNGLDWISNEKNTVNLGYKFERFFGSWSFEFLENLKAEEISNIDMLGYCPQFGSIPVDVWAERIDILKKRFKGKKLLVGPCVDLYSTINQKTNSADYTGFELNDSEKIDKFVRGDYDSFIENTLNYRDEIGVFITYYQKFFNDRQFTAAMEKIMLDGHLFGVTTIPDSDFLFELMYQNSCRNIALSRNSL